MFWPSCQLVSVFHLGRRKRPLFHDVYGRAKSFILELSWRSNQLLCHRSKNGVAFDIKIKALNTFYVNHRLQREVSATPLLLSLFSVHNSEWNGACRKVSKLSAASGLCVTVYWIMQDNYVFVWFIANVGNGLASMACSHNGQDITYNTRHRQREGNAMSWGVRKKDFVVGDKSSY